MTAITPNNYKNIKCKYLLYSNIKFENILDDFFKINLIYCFENNQGLKNSNFFKEFNDTFGIHNCNFDIEEITIKNENNKTKDYLLEFIQKKKNIKNKSKIKITFINLQNEGEQLPDTVLVKNGIYRVNIFQEHIPLVIKTGQNNTIIQKLSSDLYTYIGETVNGGSYGKGIYVSFKNNQISSITKGNFIHAVLWGEGKDIVFINNTVCIYEGTFSNGKLHGNGKINFFYNKYSTDIYEGNFVNNKLNGIGKIICKYSDYTKTTEGNFVDNELNGIGKIICKYSDYTNSTEGNFVDNKLNGIGKIICKYSDYTKTREGNFINNWLNGIGKKIYKYDTYTVLFEGIFLDDFLNGEGKRVYEYNEYTKIMEGVFVKDNLDENGKIMYEYK
jgi:hypothetical protein